MRRYRPSPDVSGRTSFAGQLLIASPHMREPFDHAVILMARQVATVRSASSSTIHRQPSHRRVLQALGADASGVKNSVQLFLGGPVSPISPSSFTAPTIAATNRGHRRPRRAERCGRRAARYRPRQRAGKSLVALGYAGWAPSQLEEEIARGAWVTVPEDPALVFDDDRAKVWTDALALHKTDR